MIIGFSAFVCLLFAAAVLMWMHKWALCAPHEDLNWGETPSYFVGFVRYPVAWAAGSMACTMAYVTWLWANGIYPPDYFRFIAVLGAISAAISLGIATIWVKWINADISSDVLIRVHYGVLAVTGVVSFGLLFAVGLGNIR